MHVFSNPGTNTKFGWCKGYSFLTIFVWGKNIFCIHPNYFGWYYYELLLHVFFFSEGFFLKCLSYYRTSLTTHNLPYHIVPCRQGSNGAAPPSSKIMPKHDEDSSGIGKKKLADSWGQCTLFQSNGQKKHKYSLKKHTFSPRARRSMA